MTLLPAQELRTPLVPTVIRTLVSAFSSGAFGAVAWFTLGDELAGLRLDQVIEERQLAAVLLVLIALIMLVMAIGNGMSMVSAARGKFCLRLTHEGFAECWLSRERFTPWHSIGTLTIVRRNGIKFVMFCWIHAGDGPLDRYRAKIGSLRGHYGMKPEALADLMNRYRDAALGRDGHSGERGNPEHG